MIDPPSGSLNPEPAQPTLRANTLLHLGVAGLATLAAAAFLAHGGLGLRGLLTSAVLALIAGGVLLATLPAALPGNRFGRANSVTLGRLALTCVLAGALSQAASPGAFGDGTAWSLCLLALLALALDGLDGWIARRYGETSSFGARFDMEADALFLLIVALLAAALDKAGAWVLLSGLWRYGFVALCLALPRLREPLPESRRRKRVFVLQAALLIACLAPPVVPPLSTALAGLGLAALTLSFTIDLAWLARKGAQTR